MPLQLTRFGYLFTVLLLLPWLALMGLGVYYLWQQGWLYLGLGLLSAHAILFYSLLSWHKPKQQPLLGDSFTIKPNPNWPDKAQQAWLEIEQLRKRWQTQTDVLTDANKALKLSNEVLALVAGHFHADSKHPVLEFPLPYLLRLIVLVCEDIQHDVLDKIPGSHAVRVGDLIRAKQAVTQLKRLKALFTVGNWLFNWSGAALAKARAVLVGKGLATVTDEISQRLIAAYIDKLGYYAIQLYSGQLTLDDMLPTDQLSDASIEDTVTSEQHKQSVEPLRILILGQVSSGKSSLINALFGEVKSAEGLLPTTAEITPYILERDGLQQAILLDSAGYGGLTHGLAAKALKQQWAKVDVILIVCNAAQAARQDDAQQLDAIRTYFQEECQNRTLPVIIAVATQIDRLRPLREWQPPYNIQQAETAKALAIRQACAAIARDLALPLSRVVPVCLAPEKPVYNIEEGLMPLLYELLDEVQRVRYLRCLRTHQARSYWQQWRKQAGQLGQIILGD
ncbi:MAG: 50S ribosome-binding GTPase [Methylococcales bacterium]|nr:50S ribosome-binding GTPase [Methylococcales bacterium]